MDLAPIVVIAGSYFPAWILSLLLGVIASVTAYGLLLRIGLAGSAPNMDITREDRIHAY